MQFIFNSKDNKPLTKEIPQNEKQNAFLSLYASRETH